MPVLTSRERVNRALNHQEPDLVPIDIGSTAAWFTDIAYERMKEYLGVDSHGEHFRLGENAGHYDEKLLDLLDTDYRHVYVRPSQRDRDSWNASDKMSYIDEWGVRRRRVPSDYGGWNWERVSYPLADATMDDLDVYPWPDASDPLRVEGMAARAKSLWENTDYAVAARAVSHGLFELAWELRGMEQFLVDMMLSKPFAHKLLQKILDVQIGLYSSLLDAVGPYVQVVQTADDYGSQTGPMFSPALYREMIMPYRQELNRLIRSKAPQAKIQHHTCGSVYRLLPDLIETGIDILNPVQPLAADMDPARLKAEFGEQIVFHGAIDLQEGMIGSPERVREEVVTRIKQLAPGGGYIIAPCSNFQADSTVENICTMLTTAREAGRYPII
jgi:uroporphyrinogen decarboxylase